LNKEDGGLHFYFYYNAYKNICIGKNEII
jgi:hypothetical protein